MKKKVILIIGIVIALLVGGGAYYRFSHLRTGGGHTVHKEAGHSKEKSETGEVDQHDKHEEEHSVMMAVEIQRKNGVTIAVVKKERLRGTITATGKLQANADRIAHVSPRIPGKIVAVEASLGDSIVSDQVMAVIDSVELGEALNRYHQSKTRLGLAKNNMERIKTLVEKKIAARKDILQAETDYQTTLTELHTDEERLLLYGLAPAALEGMNHKRPLLPVRSPIGGVVTEKHAIVGELADPSKSLYTVADLSTVWVLVDINENDLAKVRRGQSAVVTVGAYPDSRFRGQITYIADLMDEATRTVKARLEVHNPGRKLKPEMFATVELALQSAAAPVPAVPEDALQDLEGKKVLFVTENGTEFAARRVEAGRAVGGMVEIVSGLKEGERYAVKGSFILKSELKKGELVDEHGHK